MADVKPLSGEYFLLDLNGVEGDLKFTSCTLPSGTLSPAAVPYINGQAKSEKASIPVGINWQDVNISRALDDKGSFWEWFKQGIPDEGGGTGKMEKKDINLQLCDSDGGTVKTWILTGAFPTSYQGGGTLNAGSSDVLVESMSLQYDHCKVE